MVQPTPLSLWITWISMESPQQFRLRVGIFGGWVKREPISKCNSQWPDTSLRPALTVAGDDTK